MTRRLTLYRCVFGPFQPQGIWITPAHSEEDARERLRRYLDRGAGRWPDGPVRDNHDPKNADTATITVYTS